MKLQALFNRAIALDKACFTEAAKARDSEARPSYRLLAWDEGMAKARKARQPQYAALQAECGDVSGHIYEYGECLVCGHKHTTARAVSDANLLKW